MRWSSFYFIQNKGEGEEKNRDIHTSKSVKFDKDELLSDKAIIKQRVCREKFIACYVRHSKPFYEDGDTCATFDTSAPV